MSAPGSGEAGETDKEGNPFRSSRALLRTPEGKGSQGGGPAGVTKMAEEGAATPTVLVPNSDTEIENPEASTMRGDQIYSDKEDMDRGGNSKDENSKAGQKRARLGTPPEEADRNVAKTGGKKWLNILANRMKGYTSGELPVSLWPAEVPVVEDYDSALASLLTWTGVLDQLCGKHPTTKGEIKIAVEELGKMARRIKRKGTERDLREENKRAEHIGRITRLEGENSELKTDIKRFQQEAKEMKARIEGLQRELSEGRPREGEGSAETGKKPRTVRVCAPDAVRRWTTKGPRSLGWLRPSLSLTRPSRRRSPTKSCSQLSRKTGLRRCFIESR